MGVYKNDTPNFFPLKKSQGDYQITKNCPSGQGWGEHFAGEGNAYCVEYRGSDVFMNSQSGNSNFFRITVGKSAIDLEPFNEKKVKNIEGKFTSSSKQCVQDRCIDIYGPLAVLDIDKLELAK